jgi:hypothetical protein
VRPRVHAALVAPALIFFSPALFFHRALYVRDTGIYFYPHKAWIAAMLRSLQLPQWSAQEFGGLPIIADPNYNFFHPLGLLTDFLPLPWGFQLFVFTAVLLASYSAYWLGRELRLSGAASILCAWTFAWSGPFVSLMESGSVLVVASIPGLFAATVRLRRTGATRDLLLVAVTAALLFFTGVPEVAGAGFLLALVLSGRRLPKVLAGCALGAGLAAIQLFPTAAFVRESSRGMGFGPEPAFRFLRIPALIFPLFDGWLDAPGVPYWSFAGTPWVEAVYLGAVVLLLASFGLKKQWPVLLAALAFACLATTPGFAEARVLLPPLRDLRFGDKFILPLAMAVPIAAATGFDRLTANKQLLRPALGMALLSLVCFAAAAFSPFAGFAAPQIECLRVTALRYVPLELAMLSAALVCVAHGRKHFLFAILAVELGLPAATLNRTIPAEELIAKTPLEPVLADAGRDFRIDVQSAGLHNEDAGSIGEPDWLRTHQIFTIRHLALYDPGTAPELLLMRGYSGFPSGLMKDLYAKGDLNLLSVRYGVEFGSGGRSIYPALGFRLVSDRGLVRIFRNDRALPRIRMEPHGSVKLVEERNDALRIEVDAAAPSRLVVADTMARGWTATIDGAKASPLPGALRVIDVPAGKHAVRWSYLAPGLFAGAIVSLLSLIVALTLWRRGHVGGSW